MKNDDGIMDLNDYLEIKKNKETVNIEEMIRSATI